MKFLNWLNENLEKYIASILFMLLTGVMILNVIMRYIFKNALAWASEVVLILFIWFVWFTVSYAFKERAHIKVTAIVSLLPEKFQIALRLIVSISILIFFVIIMKTGIELLGHYSVRGKTSLLLKYPMWLFYLSAPAGVGLSILRIIQNSYKDYIELKQKSI
ncbi:Ectoine/5-hydroxyectoine TRAP transporter small permease protein UehB [Koleobacter methoxysyntrophicus]|uniref:Ectoine/5-hydroxyectoine TRAP transporter small permease protein UehB n=1 Tax=Koleobacter methoxysyntrophicus TaxID=2751313 RepID=A0A8A0RPE0_9FIRM|nr:TRAP transporter small permease [Koleobacter methoxysyntrophicus]MDK2901660.1 C4-dicarboxylate transporter, DctQ subunit [Thermosediminibacterales bacterium]QSQ09277.1 Ectoine/5-hydroxyectoine TRAP transporter small permease protein UehB [Koleobacter methoxysyntrophicus]